MPSEQPTGSFQTATDSSQKRERSKDRDQSLIPEGISVATSDFRSEFDEREKPKNPLHPWKANRGSMVVWKDMDGLHELLMVQMQKDDIEEVVKAMCAFSKKLLANHNNNDKTEEYAKETLILGGHTVVFLAMKKWENNEQLQRAGCSCILLLARHMRNTIVAAGGMEVVVSAMKLFPNSKLVQRSGCAALSSFYVQFQSAPFSVKIKLHKFVTEQDGLIWVIQAMRRFPQESDVQDICCRFLCNLSRSHVFCEVLRKIHAMSAVTSALEKHPDHDAILFCAKKITAAVLAKD